MTDAAKEALVAQFPIANAADLLKVLTEKIGDDLSQIYVQNGVGEDFGTVAIYETTLTDGSKVRSLSFWLDEKYR